MMCDLIRKSFKRTQFWFVMFVLSFCAYSVMIINELTNTYDGMWAGSYYSSYGWMIRTGRWFWPFIGLARRNLSPEPFTNLLSLGLYVSGVCLIISIFKLFEKKISYILALAMLINVAVCSRMSYRFASPTFGVAFLFGIASVWVMLQTGWNLWFKWVLSTILFVMSFASYQMEIGCVCVLVLSILIVMITENRIKEAVAFGAGEAVSILVGGGIYKIIWDLFMEIFSLNVTDYRGAGDFSVGNVIRNLPKTVCLAYKEFVCCFLDNGNIRYSIFHDVKALRIVFSLLFIGLSIAIVVLGCRKVFAMDRTMIVKICIVVCMFVLLFFFPVGANLCLLLSPESGDVSVQMTLPMMICLPLLSCVFIHLYESDMYGTVKKIGMICTIGSIFLLLYGNVGMVSVDQHAMFAGKETTKALMNRIASDIEKSGLFDEKSEDKFVFVGKPSDNFYYHKDDLWNYSNDFAHYGNIWTGGDCCTQSYNGVLRDSGIYLPFSYWDYKDWNRISQIEEVIKMPAYPDKGYIKKIDNWIVVKVSE